MRFYETENCKKKEKSSNKQPRTSAAWMDGRAGWFDDEEITRKLGNVKLESGLQLQGAATSPCVHFMCVCVLSSSRSFLFGFFSLFFVVQPKRPIFIRLAIIVRLKENGPCINGWMEGKCFQWRMALKMAKWSKNLAVKKVINFQKWQNEIWDFAWVCDPGTRHHLFWIHWIEGQTLVTGVFIQWLALSCRKWSFGQKKPRNLTDEKG